MDRPIKMRAREQRSKTVIELDGPIHENNLLKEKFLNIVEIGSCAPPSLRG